VGIFPYIGFKIGLIYGRYLQCRILKWPLIISTSVHYTIVHGHWLNSPTHKLQFADCIITFCHSSFCLSRTWEPWTERDQHCSAFAPWEMKNQKCQDSSDRSSGRSSSSIVVGSDSWGFGGTRDAQKSRPPCWRPWQCGPHPDFVVVKSWYTKWFYACTHCTIPKYSKPRKVRKIIYHYNFVGLYFWFLLGVWVVLFISPFESKILSDTLASQLILLEILAAASEGYNPSYRRTMMRFWPSNMVI
jgi:hypothetical protein